MTVYEKIKSLSVSEMATLIAEMVDHEHLPYCNCPIGSIDEGGSGYCGKEGCDVSALKWLQSDDSLVLENLR